MKPHSLDEAEQIISKLQSERSQLFDEVERLQREIARLENLIANPPQRTFPNDPPPETPQGNR